ncbi:MAG TPA: sugar phosphate isomerase/epimerase family protein [Rectinemataceae bacterium]|nr:sugar phosphate isomerase/epimerase family protein [Rectinemataceae bacterium]
MRYAVCNELFGRRSLAESAAIARQAGYGGLEIAPYTVFGDFSSISIRAGIAAIRSALKAEGLAFAAFHWLLRGPEGLHATSPDLTTRRRTWDHLARLVEAAAELGGGPLVLGSPKQRSTTGGASRELARLNLVEGLSRLAPHCAAAGSPILIEALASEQSDIVNTLAEARAIVEEIASPGVGTMFDFHNTGDEREPWEALIRGLGPHVGHIHANEPDGSAPRRDGADLGPAFAAMRDIDYRGWISVEIFTEPEDPASTLRESMERFRELDRASASGGEALSRVGRRLS